ncbi:MAG: hypothetical protein J2P45_26380 [Candidatus Dormibacteraeota bacterium]|nr:hypothetical protein [Candidatus Dormibacteraeota bacterium]
MSEIGKRLEELAEEEEALRGEPGGPLHRTRPPRDPAQVYSVRMPVHLLDQLRRVAEDMGTTPSNLIRMWVVERLEQGSQIEQLRDQVERFRQVVSEVVGEELDRRRVAIR